MTVVLQAHLHFSNVLAPPPGRSTPESLYASYFGKLIILSTHHTNANDLNAFIQRHRLDLSQTKIFPAFHQTLRKTGSKHLDTILVEIRQRNKPALLQPPSS